MPKATPAARSTASPLPATKAGPAKSGEMWTSVRGRAIFIINRMHAIDADQQNMLGLMAL